MNAAFQQVVTDEIENEFKITYSEGYLISEGASLTMWQNKFIFLTGGPTVHKVEHREAFGPYFEPDYS